MRLITGTVLLMVSLYGLGYLIDKGVGGIGLGGMFGVLLALGFILFFWDLSSEIRKKG